jgi:hypothetical protein
MYADEYGGKEIIENFLNVNKVLVNEKAESFPCRLLHFCHLE